MNTTLVTTIDMILGIAGGALILLFGRRLYWVFIGVLGLFFGLYLTAFFSSTYHWPGWITLLAALVLGLACAALAENFQRVMFAVLGFVGGGFALLMVGNIIQSLVGNTTLDWWNVGLFFVGGVLGAFLMGRFTDWGLIILSALAGADAIVTAIDRPLHLPSPLATLIVLALSYIGIAVQSDGISIFSEETLTPVPAVHEAQPMHMRPRRVQVPQPITQPTAQGSV